MWCVGLKACGLGACEWDGPGSAPGDCHAWGFSSHEGVWCAPWVPGGGAVVPLGGVGVGRVGGLAVGAM